MQLKRINCITQITPLFGWFIGLSMDDAMLVSSVLTNNRTGLIEHKAFIELF